MKIFETIKRVLKRKPIKGYVSPIDIFLREFDLKFPQKSRSQLEEIAKFQRIFYFRDHSNKN